MKIFLIISLLSFHSIHCYVISDDKDEEARSTTLATSGDKEPEDLNTLLVDISKTAFGDDIELIKEMAKEIDEELSDSSREVLENMKRNFVAQVLRLHEGGELYKDARKEAILSSLRAAYLETSGDVDPTFIAEISRKLQQKEHQKRKKAKEFETNGLKTQTKDQSLKN